MADEKKKDKPKPKPPKSPVGFIVVVILITLAISKTSWGKKYLESQTASSTGTVSTSTATHQ